MSSHFKSEKSRMQTPTMSRYNYFKSTNYITSTNNKSFDFSQMIRKWWQIIQEKNWPNNIKKAKKHPPQHVSQPIDKVLVNSDHNQFKCLTTHQTEKQHKQNVLEPTDTKSSACTHSQHLKSPYGHWRLHIIDCNRLQAGGQEICSRFLWSATCSSSRTQSSEECCQMAGWTDQGWTSHPG